jgi:hypothetical protein
MSATTVRVLYRYAASANLKARPPYFSKELAVASFVRAIRSTDGRARATFVVDGSIEDSLLDVMSSAGDVVRGSYGSNRASYGATVSMAGGLCAGEDLTWFAEDDYLYEADSLAGLLAAADAIPEAGWFAMSGPTPPVMLEMRRAQGPVDVPPLARPGGVVEVGGRPWHRIDSTTSTFGGRTSRVVHDARLLRAVPWTGAAWDRTTCLAVQGVTPYPWAHVLDDLVVPSTPARMRALRVAWRITGRVAVNLRSMRLAATRGVLVAPVTPLIGHMNLPYEERPEHWGAVAAAVREWAGTTGLVALPAPAEGQG